MVRLFNRILEYHYVVSFEYLILSWFVVIEKYWMLNNHRVSYVIDKLDIGGKVILQKEKTR